MAGELKKVSRHFFLPKNGERSRPPPKAMAGQARLRFTLFASCRKAAIAKAPHSKGAAFSSHLHQIPEKPCL